MYKSFSIILLLPLLLVLNSCKNKALEKPSEVFEQKVIDEKTILQTICFGSCNKQWEDQSYWNVILAEDPDLWIWMGDIIYSDTEDMEQLKKQYDFQKNHEEYRQVLDSTMVLGIWDDHDYGVNDGGNAYPKRKESRDLLFEFLDIPSVHQAYQREGAYQSYIFGTGDRKVKVILLDGRYFKDEMAKDYDSKHRYLPNEKGTYLGVEQWTWLEKELEQSDASFHVFVSGVQLISDAHYFEKWSNFPLERKKMYDLLVKYRVKNPVFLSGDRHIAEISAIKLDSFVNPVYDVTSSGLTHSYEKADEENEYRVGELIKVKNFGVIEIEWSDEKLNVSLLVKSIEGKELLRQELELNY